MLPSHQPRFQRLSETKRYQVQSSDVLDQLRINVCEEGSEDAVWYSERFLADDEIIESVIDRASGRTLWLIHRPARGGWYLRIRSPSAREYIALGRPPTSSPFFSEAALSFLSPARTGAWAAAAPLPPKRGSWSGPLAARIVPGLASGPGARPIGGDLSRRASEAASVDSEATAVVHSYPPTPPAGAPPPKPPSPRTVRAQLDRLTSEPGPSTSQTPVTSPVSISGASWSGVRPSLAPAAAATLGTADLLLAPHSTPHAARPGAGAGLLQRVFAAVLDHKPSHSASFTLFPLPPDGVGVRGLRAGRTHGTGAARADGHESCIPYVPPALLTYHDQTPLLTVRSSTGLLGVDVGLERELGLDRSFLVAVALAYMDYLTERESYLAALGD